MKFVAKKADRQALRCNWLPFKHVLSTLLLLIKSKPFLTHNSCSCLLTVEIRSVRSASCLTAMLDIPIFEPGNLSLMLDARLHMF